MRYDDAVASLFQSSVEQFVAERKRLAGELKVAGDKEGAARLAKLPRPPISAWVVNQLWWHARDAFDALFESAQRLREGELDAMPAHRDAIAKLRVAATKILTDAEHGATESTLRRVTQTLSALAAAGGWEPDLPGALSADRDPPGFEAVGVSSVAPAKARDDEAGHKRESKAHDGSKAHGSKAPAQDGKAHDGKTHDGKAHGGKAHGGKAHHDEPQGATDDLRARREAAEARRRGELEAAAARAEEAAALRRAEAERARVTAERHRIEAALRTARGDVAQREREVTKLERELVHAHKQVEHAKDVVSGLEERLAQLDN
jgi:hypothetical protein